MRGAATTGGGDWTSAIAQYRMRGSSRAYSMSATMLANRKKAEITRVKPWMTGKSRVTTAFSTADPMPGTAKMYSIVTWMPIMLPNWTATMVMNGIMAFLSAWTITMVEGRRPFARAVRM